MALRPPASCQCLLLSFALAGLRAGLSGPTEVESGPQLVEFRYQTRPDDGGEPLGLAQVGGELPTIVEAAGFSYSHPAWLGDDDALSRFGPSSRDGSASWPMSDPVDLPYTRSQTLEELVAYLMFFFGRRDGTFLELGSHWGVLGSNMYVLEESFGWRGVNIEASSAIYDRLLHNRPAQVNVNGVICNKPGQVHFLERREGGITSGISGVVEFMAPTFLEVWHPTVNGSHFGVVSEALNADGSPRQPLPPGLPSNEGSDAREARCVPLTTVLETLGMSHINFWILDVEGGELQVLFSVDFDKITFDVIAVEADGHNPEKDAAVVELLVSKGYKFCGFVARSNWFARHGFVASVAPERPRTAQLQQALWGILKLD